MTTWHSKNVGDGVEALPQVQKLHQAFIALAKAGGLAPTIGVFSVYDLHANVVTWYFSPEATLLAQAFGANPCDKPIPDGDFALTVGDARARDFHFPNYRAQRSRGEF